jgi:hypothetical protein
MGTRKSSRTSPGAKPGPAKSTDHPAKTPDKVTGRVHPGGKKHAVPQFRGDVPLAGQVEAYQTVCAFTLAHSEEYARVGFGAAEMTAADLAYEVGARLLASQPGSARHRTILPPDAGVVVERAHHYTFLARDAVRRLEGDATDLPRGAAKKHVGPRRRAAFALRRRFGFAVHLVRHSPEAVRAAAAAFLAGAKKDPETAARAYLTGEFLAKLEGAVAALDALLATKRATRAGNDEASADGVRAQEALDRFFRQFAAATNIAYADDEGTRVMALRLVPRGRDLHRKEPRPAPEVPGVLPADVGVPPAPPPKA